MADSAYKRRLGDRKEGRQLRSLSPYVKLIPFIMVKRNDGCNSFQDSVEITEADRYLRQKQAEGYSGIGFLHLFIAAYVRTIAMRPGINRFVAGQRIFARNGINVIITVKRSSAADAAETSIRVAFEPTDTLFDVHRKLSERVDEIMAGEFESNTEQLAGALFRIPRLLMKFAVWLLNLLDYFDMLPNAMLKASPFHGSLVIADMGSFGIPPINHHLYNFGNLPVFLSFGAKRRTFEMDEDRVFSERRYIDYAAVLDERICDGYYYSSAFKYFKYFLKNPQLLEIPPEKVEQDVF